VTLDSSSSNNSQENFHNFLEAVSWEHFPEACPLAPSFSPSSPPLPGPENSKVLVPAYVFHTDPQTYFRYQLFPYAVSLPGKTGFGGPQEQLHWVRFDQPICLLQGSQRKRDAYRFLVRTALSKLHILLLGTQLLPAPPFPFPSLQGRHGNTKARAVVMETVL
jgi:hypothetical protein